MLFKWWRNERFFLNSFFMYNDLVKLKLKCEFFDECVKALTREPLISKIIVLDDLLKIIQTQSHSSTPTYYNTIKDPTFFKDGIKTTLKDGIYYKGFKISDL